MTDFKPLDLAATRKREQTVNRIIGIAILTTIAVIMTAGGLTVAGVI